ncbi:hypothetical protein ACROYT_G014306 [Oculina patagonica]
MTLDVENCQATIHAKKVNMSKLEFARAFGATMKESALHWAAFYHTSRRLWYPKPNTKEERQRAKQTFQSEQLSFAGNKSYGPEIYVRNQHKLFSAEGGKLKNGTTKRETLKEMVDS